MIHFKSIAYFQKTDQVRIPKKKKKAFNLFDLNIKFISHIYFQVDIL